MSARGCLWALVSVLFIAFIFYNSSLPMDASKHFSGFALVVLEFFAKIFNFALDGDAEYKVRKLAHFCEFALLAWLLCQSFAANFVAQRTANGYILFLCLLVAAVDEYIQIFAPGRTARITDVLLDFSGAFSMWLCVRVWQFCRK